MTVAGQNINELTATTTFAERQLDVRYDGAPAESGALGGRRAQPAARSAGAEASAPGSRVEWGAAAARARFDGRCSLWRQRRQRRQLEVDERRRADLPSMGRSARRAPTLEVAATNVDLATVDALLLREPQLSGRFEATSTITGTTDDPHASGTFAVSNGGFRQFRYDSLGGTFDYTLPGVNLDARLQQNASQWLTAKGYLPVALFRGGGDRRRSTGADGCCRFSRRPHRFRGRQQPDRSGTGAGLYDGAHRCEGSGRSPPADQRHCRRSPARRHPDGGQRRA